MSSEEPTPLSTDPKKVYASLVDQYAQMLTRERDRESHFPLRDLRALEHHHRKGRHTIHNQIRALAKQLGIEDARIQIDFIIAMGNLEELMISDIPVARLPLPSAFLEADEHRYLLTPKSNGHIVSQQIFDPNSFPGTDIESAPPIEGRENEWESGDFAVFVYALPRTDPTQPATRESETLQVRKQKAIALARGEGLNLFMAISENSDGNQSRLYGVEVPYDRIVSTTQAIRQNYNDYLVNSTHYPTLS